ncbi:hypothetical protein GO003_013730 [Methylicorpusculum oleiharenae]|uniref:hypothetical protein n=1 Tax=Methylicorpusculum oleiharenae TaxID=1338687 RepID=UPI001358C259|nr:hypothetical protein [Methylicorpusculum oleiharenae]MCD2451450.1 hypothetical protein [Methylicorpusculum oleiharenae]
MKNIEAFLLLIFFAGSKDSNLDIVVVSIINWAKDADGKQQLVAAMWGCLAAIARGHKMQFRGITR